MELVVFSLLVSTVAALVNHRVSVDAAGASTFFTRKLGGRNKIKLIVFLVFGCFLCNLLRESHWVPNRGRARATPNSKHSEKEHLLALNCINFQRVKRANHPLASECKAAADWLSHDMRRDFERIQIIIGGRMGNNKSQFCAVKMEPECFCWCSKWFSTNETSEGTGTGLVPKHSEWNSALVRGICHILRGVLVPSFFLSLPRC